MHNERRGAPSLPPSHLRGIFDYVNSIKDVTRRESTISDSTAKRDESTSTRRPHLSLSLSLSLSYAHARDDNSGLVPERKTASSARHPSSSLLTLRARKFAAL